ncbi:MAG: UvrB/UvrC motif-containing protein [Clostridia bacterium]|nr:UvrB/UvrC motif-containing protein [Clostridia bacterium]
MLCQKCEKKEATVLFKHSVNGKYKEMMLCHECAEKENVTGFFTHGADELFSGFFSDTVFGGYVPEQKKCPQCGLSYGELARNGRAGCAKCYDVFAPEMEKIVYGIHGNARHAGSAPGNRAEQIKKKSEIEALKKEQQEAVLEQNYERAAELRDKIRELEGGEGK